MSLYTDERLSKKKSDNKKKKKKNNALNFSYSQNVIVKEIKSLKKITQKLILQSLLLLLL